MSALVRTIRRAILGDVANKNQVLKAALEELGITAGQSDPTALLKLQQIILNSGRDSEVLLRRAFNGLNLTGGGTGHGEVHRIRNALLRSGREAELRAAIDDLISLESGPELPDGAIAYADFVNQDFYAGGDWREPAAVLGSLDQLTADGLVYVPVTLDDEVTAIGELATTLLTCDWRIVFDFVIPDPLAGGAITFLGINTADEHDILAAAIYGSPEAGAEAVDWIDDGNEELRSAVVDANGLQAGVNQQFTITRNDTAISSKLNDGATVTDGSFSFSLNPDVVRFFAGVGYTTDRELHLKKMTVYPSS